MVVSLETVQLPKRALNRLLGRLWIPSDIPSDENLSRHARLRCPRTRTGGRRLKNTLLGSNLATLTPFAAHSRVLVTFSFRDSLSSRISASADLTRFRASSGSSVSAQWSLSSR